MGARIILLKVIVDALRVMQSYKKRKLTESYMQSQFREFKVTFLNC